MADGAPQITKPHEPFLMGDLLVGEPDPRGRKVLDILWSVEEFKIFKTERGISPFFSDDPAVARKQKEAYLAMGEDIASFNHLIQTLSPSGFRIGGGGGVGGPSLIEYERELARCIAQALLGHGESARTSLNGLQRRLGRQISNRARVIHLGINVLLVLGVWLAAYLISISGYQPRFGFEPKNITLAAIMGSVGALFSTAVSLQRMAVDPMVPLIMHWIYGGQRVLVGVLGAIILYFGLLSGVLEGILQTPAAGVNRPPVVDNHWLAFVSVLAGFSERLVPNLLDARVDASTARKAEDE